MKQGNVVSAPLRGWWLRTPTRMLSNSRASMRANQGTPGLGLAANGHLRPRAPPASNLPAWAEEATMRSSPGRKARRKMPPRERSTEGEARCRHKTPSQEVPVRGVA